VSHHFPAFQNRELEPEIEPSFLTVGSKEPEKDVYLDAWLGPITFRIFVLRIV
jgi:hypothetical protein